MVNKEIQNHPELFERKETLVPFHEAHKHFPCRTSASSVYRWFRQGVRTSNGHCYLETVVSGGRRYTSHEAIKRFILSQQQPSSAQVNAAAPVPANNGTMTEGERRRKMKRLGLRPQGAKWRGNGLIWSQHFSYWKVTNAVYRSPLSWLVLVLFVSPPYRKT